MHGGVINEHGMVHGKDNHNSVLQLTTLRKLTSLSAKFWQFSAVISQDTLASNGYLLHVSHTSLPRCLIIQSGNAEIQVHMFIPNIQQIRYTH